MLYFYVLLARLAMRGELGRSSFVRPRSERSLALSAGERLMVIKSLVPGLLDAMGLAECDAFLTDV
ncbi:hypothetical protein BH09GEM1_BH09GEM1_45460 [soil metagenome]